MSEIRRIEVQCQRCLAWFPSPYHMGDVESFDSLEMSGCTAQCHSCGAEVPCNKENMRFAVADGSGGWRGDDTV